MDLEGIGYKVFRCSNEEVLRSPELVYNTILEKFDKNNKYVLHKIRTVE